jgi:hypothetical protein
MFTDYCNNNNNNNKVMYYNEHTLTNDIFFLGTPLWLPYCKK